MNRLTRKTGVAKHLSPLTTSTSASKLDFTKLNLSLGEFAEVCEDNGCQTNSANDRGASTITLKQVHNSFRSYYFYSLVAGRRLTRGQSTINPMPP